ncbi:MAG: ATP-dependent DNA helicase [Lachnospiraceae bacterium]|nr:ATP-dependent DNA helicase [Lachnospiraceae bacterium]
MHFKRANVFGKQTPPPETVEDAAQKTEKQTPPPAESAEDTAPKTGKKASFRLSVRELVEFLRRDGGLDDRVSARAEQEAMLKGAKLHRKLQSSAGPEYKSEVPLSKTIEYDDYTITVEGRADGVFAAPAEISDEAGNKSIVNKSDTAEKEDSPEIPEPEELEIIKVIDEIKGVYLPLDSLDKPIPVHLAQALCYACFLAEKENLDKVGVQITYIQMDEEEIRRFRSDWTREDLEQWFEDLITEYRQFTDYYVEHIRRRDRSMDTLTFPFPYREGQKTLVSAVYRTISDEKKMYLEAPTGVGKTMAVLYPSIRAVGEQKAEKIFYLSARTVAQAAAVEAFEILADQGLEFRVLRLTAKEKTCFLNEPSCNPADCPYADGYFAKRAEALLWLLRGEFNTSGKSSADISEEENRRDTTDIFNSEIHQKKNTIFNREIIKTAAEKFKVCPYELSLDLSLWLDGVICDYNYAFDPDARLKRFFADHSKRDYIFLIDEAHNLVDRACSMYSAELIKEEILKARKLVKDRYKRAEKAFSGINKKMLAMKRELEEEWGEKRGIPYKVLGNDRGLAIDALNAMGEIEKLFDETRDSELKKELLDVYFMLRSYVNMSEYLGENYVIYEEINPDGQFVLHEYCIDPSERLKDCLECARGAVFFSATLLPIQYYRDLLGAEEADYAVYAESPFDPAKRGIFLVTDVSTKYTRRSEGEYRRIAAAISQVVAGKKGNYIAFFPSHKMMMDVFKIYRAEFDRPDVNWVVQGKYMGEEDREIFMEDFENNNDGNMSLIGFCVMGGIFSEGIDLTGERLIGAIVVGTGLPQISNEGEIRKNALDEQDINGFDYAYRFPGMNKVLQAAGRVIRTAEDVGIVVLMDDRFLQNSYQKLFPREWKSYTICDSTNVGEAVSEFWGQEK